MTDNGQPSTQSATAAAVSAKDASQSAKQAETSASAAAASATAAALAVASGTSGSDKYHHKKEAYLARYAEHNARLQTWIGGYGAGLASLLVYQFRTAISDAKELWKSHGGTDFGKLLVEKLTSMHSDLACALTLIAIALAVQVVLLYLNKATQFSITHSDDEESKWTWWEKKSEWFSGSYWIDALIDATSVVLLGIATFAGINALGLVP